MNRLLYMNIGHFQNNTILHVHEQLNQIIGIYIFCYSYKRYTSISNSFLSILKDDKKAYSCFLIKVTITRLTPYLPSVTVFLYVLCPTHSPGIRTHLRPTADPNLGEHSIGRSRNSGSPDTDLARN